MRRCCGINPGGANSRHPLKKRYVPESGGVTYFSQRQQDTFQVWGEVHKRWRNLEQRMARIGIAKPTHDDNKQHAGG